MGNYQPLHAMSAAGGGALLNDGKMGAMQNPGLLDQMEKPSLAAHSTTGRGLNGDDALSSNATHSQLRRSGNNSTSFEALLTLDFESMQSMENLEQIKKQGPKAMEKNVSWGSESNYPNAKLSNGGQVLPNGAGKHAGHEQGRSDANGRYGSVGTALRNFSSSKLSANAANSFRGPSMDYQELYRVHSSTGLTALREQQGLNARNSSVDDFLSLVASGDIPAQDPQMLNLPLQSILNSVRRNPSQQNLAALQHIQQQLMAQHARLAGSSGPVDASQQNHHLFYQPTGAQVYGNPTQNHHAQAQLQQQMIAQQQQQQQQQHAHAQAQQQHIQQQQQQQQAVVAEVLATAKDGTGGKKRIGDQGVTNGEFRSATRVKTETKS